MVKMISDCNRNVLIFEQLQNSDILIICVKYYDFACFFDNNCTYICTAEKWKIMTRQLRTDFQMLMNFG